MNEVTGDSDCIHEVKPVLEGYRVTITHSIVVSDKYEFSRFRYLQEPASTDLKGKELSGTKVDLA